MDDVKIPTCGDCIHADVCARVPYFTEFSRDNPAYCKNFKNKAGYVEVVHGEWTIIKDDYCGLIGLECSECEITWWFEDEYSFGKYHYCPGCGAKMDGERKDND